MERRGGEEEEDALPAVVSFNFSTCCPSKKKEIEIFVLYEGSME